MTREVIELRGMQVSDIQIRSNLIAIHTSGKGLNHRKIQTDHGSRVKTKIIY